MRIPPLFWDLQFLGFTQVRRRVVISPRVAYVFWSIRSVYVGACSSEYRSTTPFCIVRTSSSSVSCKYLQLYFSLRIEAVVGFVSFLLNIRLKVRVRTLNKSNNILLYVHLLNDSWVGGWQASCCRNSTMFGRTNTLFWELCTQALYRTFSRWCLSGGFVQILLRGASKITKMPQHQPQMDGVSQASSTKTAQVLTANKPTSLQRQSVSAPKKHPTPSIQSTHPLLPSEVSVCGLSSC